MSAKTTELKPCPFCGSGNVRYKEAEHAVVCEKCRDEIDYDQVRRRKAKAGEAS